MVREFLEYYRMEYSLSVYLPEVNMQGQEMQGKEDLGSKMGMQVNLQGGPLLVQMINKLKQGAPKEEKKDPPIIEEDIVEEIIDDTQQQQVFENEGHGGSISLGVDQSIDTLRMDEYDYIEEVKWTNYKCVQSPEPPLELALHPLLLLLLPPALEHLPKPQGLVRSRRSNSGPARTQRQVEHPTGVTPQLADLAHAGVLPDAQLVVNEPVRRQDLPLVRVPLQRTHLRVSLQTVHKHLLPLPHIPKLHALVPRTTPTR